MIIHYSWIGFIGVFLINSCYLPQLIKTIKSKKAGDISLMFYVLLISGMCFSLTYAICRRDIVYILSGILSIMQSGLMIFLKLKYTKHTDVKKVNDKNNEENIEDVWGD